MDGPLRIISLNGGLSWTDADGVALTAQTQINDRGPASGRFRRTSSRRRSQTRIAAASTEKKSLAALRRSMFKSSVDVARRRNYYRDVAPDAKGRGGSTLGNSSSCAS